MSFVKLLNIYAIKFNNEDFFFRTCDKVLYTYSLQVNNFTLEGFLTRIPSKNKKCGDQQEKHVIWNRSEIYLKQNFTCIIQLQKENVQIKKIKIIIQI